MDDKLRNIHKSVQSDPVKYEGPYTGDLQPDMGHMEVLETWRSWKVFDFLTQ